MAAIFHCLLALPANRKVIIYSDSQAAINGIQHARGEIDKKKNMARVWFRGNNVTLISSIIDMLDSKQISLELVKVKGHSDNIGNNIVDNIAKEAGYDGIDLSSNPVQLKNITYQLTWNNITVERSLRKFIRQLTETIHQTDWSLNRCVRNETCSLSSIYEWDVTWHLIQAYAGTNNNS